MFTFVTTFKNFLVKCIFFFTIICTSSFSSSDLYSTLTFPLSLNSPSINSLSNSNSQTTYQTLSSIDSLSDSEYNSQTTSPKSSFFNSYPLNIPLSSFSEDNSFANNNQPIGFSSRTTYFPTLSSTLDPTTQNYNTHYFSYGFNNGEYRSHTENIDSLTAHQ